MLYLGLDFLFFIFYFLVDFGFFYLLGRAKKIEYSMRSLLDPHALSLGEPQPPKQVHVRCFEEEQATVKRLLTSMNECIVRQRFNANMGQRSRLG